MSSKNPNKESNKPRAPRATDNRPMNVRFGEKMATELAQWQRRFENVQAIAYGRLAKGATQEQIDATISYLQTETDKCLTALRTIPERARASADAPSQVATGPFVVPGLGQARQYVPKPKA